MTVGKGAILEFDGDMDWPLPKSAVMIMKYLAGLRVLSSPMSHSLSEIEPEYQDG